MSASHASSHGALGDNVWQGYVSAVACLLLSLLLLMSILALAMVSLGNGRREGTELGSKANSSALPMEEALPDEDPAMSTQVEPPKAVATHSVSPTFGAQWALRFTPGSVDIRPSDHSTLAQKLAIPARGGAAEWRWTLWTLANPQSQSEQRLAYLRLMSVREFLLQQGARAEAIDLEIRPHTVTGSADKSTVLVSRTRDRTLQAPTGERNGRP